MGFLLFFLASSARAFLFGDLASRDSVNRPMYVAMYVFPRSVAAYVAEYGIGYTDRANRASRDVAPYGRALSGRILQFSA